MGQEHRVELAESQVASLTLVAMAADDWGGSWQAEGSDGGVLALPVQAGLRRGWVRGRLTVEPAAGGSRLTFRVDESLYRLQTASVVTLLLAAAGALVTIAAPLVPALWGLVPISVVLLVGAWLFIVARLKNSGPEEFFADLADRGGGG